MGIFFTITKVSCIWQPRIASYFNGAEKLGGLDLAVNLQRDVTDPEWFRVLTEQRVAEAGENGSCSRTRLEPVSYLELDVHK
jgi:hypothetical protein